MLEEYRLVTVTGPGGVGKTRLASEVADRVAGRFADGVQMVELAAVHEEGHVAAAVATMLGVRQAPGVPVIESIAKLLGRRQLLLVLDNCEHVLDAVAELCGSLLPSADDVRILATSRELIGVAGEARYRLGPLAVPSPEAVAKAGSYAAVVLFAERARQADPEFALTAQTAPLVGRLVARLDGMPLAIELAAARVEALGLVQLLDRLDSRFLLLTGGNRTAAARQRSLAATVDWSYQLLGEDERAAFRRLAIFPGPFTLEAAGTIAGTGAEPVVLHLVDCSLLSPPQPGPDGRSRYVMLETLRAFALDRLADGGERPDAESALAAHALKVTEQAATGMQTGDGEAAAVTWLDAEDAAVHQGLTWALEHDQPAALRIAVALAPWWHLRGRYLAGYGLLQRAAEGNPQHGSWYAAQYWLRRLAAYMSDFQAALHHNTTVCEALDSRSPSPELALALASRATALLNLNRLPDAAQDAYRALHLAREHGYPAGEAHALVALCYAAQISGDTEAALTWAQEAHHVNPHSIPGFISRTCSVVYASSLRMTGQLAEAQLVCAGGLAGARAAGDLGEQAAFLFLLAACARVTGQVDEASASLGECIAITVQAGNQLRLIDCLDECAFLCAATGRWAEAVTLWAAYTSRLQAMGVPDMAQEALLRQEPAQAAARALGPTRMREAGQRGAAMMLDTAAELAAMLTRPEPQPPGAPPQLAELSSRERELVVLVALGHTDAQIAGQLYISVSTVRSHLDRIRDKTSCRRRADLTRLALREGLI